MARGLFIALLTAGLIALVILAIVYLADISVNILGKAEEDLSRFLDVEESDKYYHDAGEWVKAMPALVVIALLFTVAVYAIHRGRR